MSGEKNISGLIDLRDKWFHVEAKLEEVQAKLEAQDRIKKIAQNDQQLQAVEQKIKNLTDKCQTLEEEKGSIQKQIDFVEKSMSDRERAFKDFQEKARKKSDAFQEKTQQEFLRVNSEIESAKKHQQEHGFSLIELSSTMDGLSKKFTQEMDSFRKDIEGLDDSLKEIGNFKEGMEGLNEKLKNIEQKTSTLQEEMQKYTTEVKGLRGELSNLKSDIRPRMQRAMSARQYVQTKSTDTVTQGISQKTMMPISKVLGISMDDGFLLKSAASSEIPKAPLPNIGERPERYQTPRQRKHPGLLQSNKQDGATEDLHVSKQPTSHTVPKFSKATHSTPKN